MNSIQICGRLYEHPIIFQKDNSREYATFKLKTRSNFPGLNGDYQYQIYDVVLWKGLKNLIDEKLPLDAFVAINGRLDQLDGKTLIIAEAIETFASDI